ncbi:MAG: nitroreductase family protein [Acidimicrobiia bacterium]
MDLYEALYTTRSMRRVSPDPVPEDVVKLMIDAAVRAPSGGNLQQWRFLAVTDRAAMTKLAELYREAFRLALETVYVKARERAAASGDERALRLVSSSTWLAENFGRMPLVVLAFTRNDPSGGSIYPAVWNMMLAARGRGIGTTLTTILGAFRSREVMELFGVPADKGWQLAAAVTAGYPLGRWGLAERKPAHEVAYAERWGEPPAWTVDEPVGYRP